MNINNKLNKVFNNSNINLKFQLIHIIILTMTQKNEIFSDTLRINEIDRDGKYFEKVSRIEATGEETDCKICLDVNIDVYPIHKDSVYSMLLTKSLDGNPSDNIFITIDQT